MVRNGFMRGMPGNALCPELLGDGTQECLFLFGERLDAGDNRLPVVSGEAVGEQNHPFDFHAHAFAVQCRFAQVFHQSGGLGMIAPIQRGEGDGW